MPPNGALHGISLDHLLRINLLWIGVVCGLVQWFLIYCLFARPVISLPHVVVSAKKVRLIEFVVLTGTIGLFAWMGITGQRMWAKDPLTNSSPTALQIQVVGMQFQWYFRYAGADGQFGRNIPELEDAATGNPLGVDPLDPVGKDDIVEIELVLPKGREVELELNSVDVIHELSIPGMRIKADAVPGQVAHLHFTPIVEGEYPIMCNQLCGKGHEQMHTCLRVVSESVFESWFAEQEKAALAQNIAR